MRAIGQSWRVAWCVFAQVALAWITTLPVAVAFGAARDALLSRGG